MAINLAEKYSSAVDEVMKLGALTASGSGAKADFTGAKTVKVYGMGTAPMHDYKASGTNRYGEPQELEDTIQELTLSRKRSFTFTIDATNAVDSPESVRDAAAALRRQLDERVFPEIDAHYTTKTAKAAKTKYIGAVSASTAYGVITDITAELDEKEVPSAGRIIYCTPSMVKFLKLSPDFIKASEMAQDMLIKGQIGEVDGMAVIKVPKSRMPAGALAVIIHPIAAASPVKLAEYKIHDNPPGVAGHLVEGLVYYDTFVLDNKANAVAVIYGELGSVNLTMEAAGTGKGKLTVTSTDEGVYAGKLVYKAGSSVTAPALGADVSGWSEVPADGIITAAAGNKVCTAISVDGKAVAASDVIAAEVGA